MSSNENVRIGIILASVRQGRRGEGVAQWVRELVAARPGVEVEWLDLREHALGPYLHEQTPSVIEKSYVDPAQRAWSETIHALDGYVLVTPEYNHGYPGQLKNALDHVQQGWWYKPACFVSYGGPAGGARAVEQLRGVCAELRMVTVRGEVNISLVNLQRDEAGRPTDPLHGKRATAMIDQLLWWARACRSARAAEAPPA
ncbi:MAG: NADPH-dependent FMN reductase [Polyangiaceae bacterium]